MSQEAAKNLSPKAELKLKSFLRDYTQPATPSPSSNAIVFPLMVVFIIALIGVVVFALYKSSKKDKNSEVESKNVNVIQQETTAKEEETKEEETPQNSQEQPQKEQVEEQVSSSIPKKVSFKDDERDDPNASFPSFAETQENDPESEFARAFTYENLQDSMLSSAENARSAIKSRDAWSRLGNRGDSIARKTQMDAIKSEITASGKSFKEFVDNSWTPIPEQMASFWKEEDQATTKEEAAETSSSFVQVQKKSLSRAAASEAPAITRDATQDVTLENVELAMNNMKEILTARKRAKTLKIDLPPLTNNQKSDLKVWSQNEDKVVAGTAKAILSL
jgi:hypothetical protein